MKNAKYTCYTASRYWDMLGISLSRLEGRAGVWKRCGRCWWKWRGLWHICRLLTRFVAHVDESCPTYEWVMALKTTHGFGKSGGVCSCHICRLPTRSWLIYTCDLTYLFICATGPIYMCDMTHVYVRQSSFACATGRIHMCDMTHLYVRHDSFRCVTGLIYVCNMTHLYVRQDPCKCATWLIYMCDRTHVNVRHDSFLCATGPM